LVTTSKSQPDFNFDFHCLIALFYIKLFFLFFSFGVVRPLSKEKLPMGNDINLRIISAEKLHQKLGEANEIILIDTLPGDHFDTDATIYRADLDKGRSLSFDATRGRRIFLYVTKGALSVNAHQVNEGGQARIDIEDPLSFKAQENAEFILIDVPSCKGWGYSEETLRGRRRV
jgi:hypothetical protein